MQKTSKSNQEGNDEFEAWMLVAGEKREGFNYSLFFEQFPNVKQHTFRIREIINIQVMREFDIGRQYAQNDGPSQEIPNNVNESDNNPRGPSVVLSGNGYKYHKKVFNQLQSSFYRPKLKPYHLYNFRDIQRNSKSSQEENDEFEAWMLVSGEKRESFDYSLFFERFPGAQEHIFRIREIKFSTYKSCKNLILCGNMHRMIGFLTRYALLQSQFEYETPTAIPNGSLKPFGCEPTSEQHHGLKACVFMTAN